MLALAISAMLAAPSPAPITLTKDVTNRAIGKDARPLLTHVGGRVVVSPLAPSAPKGAGAYRHQWPAVYWEAAFAGDQLMLRFDDDKNEYRLAIDGGPAMLLPQPGRAEFVVTRLGPGHHRVRLDKITESVDFVRTFGGFFVRGAKAALPPPSARSRQIEFVGDSGMTGYGIRSDTRICTKEEVRLRTDSGAAWPSLVAHSIGADYQINAISGIGLVRDFNGITPERVMSALYTRTLPGEARVWRDSSWHPQVVVIVLFNDFGTDIRPGERWPDRTALAGDYGHAYQKLVATIRERSPGATLVLPWPDFARIDDAAMRQLSSNIQDAIREAASQAGVPRVEFPSLPNFTPENTACDYHGSHSDHRQLAEWMTAWLNARPELWTRPEHR